MKLSTKQVYHALRRASTMRMTSGRLWRETTPTKIINATPGVGRTRGGKFAALLADRNFALAAEERGKDSAPALERRLMRRIRAKVLKEASDRGLPTILNLAKSGWDELRISDHHYDPATREHVMALHAEGWAEYSGRVGNRMATLTILGGVGPQGPWAVRIPGTIASVGPGLSWLKPAPVRAAEYNHKRVLRQGDVWIVERRRGHEDAIESLPSSHAWDPETRTLTHGGHGALTIPFHWQAYPQRTLATDGAGRRQGD